MDSIIQNRQHLASMPYTNCNTQIVSLKELDLPEQASDEEYRQIYLRYIQQAGSNRNAALLRDAIESIRHGIAPPVAFPTETVYGLGADATNEAAISGIFAAKGRPSDNPLIVHAASVAHLERLTGDPLPEIYRSLAQQFWPGPLTILLPVPKKSRFARNVHPGQATIGFRIPSSKYARFFIAACDRPIAGPSANSSGKPSPTTAQHVYDDLKGKINFILDAGHCDVGVESSVVDGLHDPPLVLRPGGVSQSDLIAHGREHGNRFEYTAIGYKRHERAGGQTNEDKYVVDDVDAAPRAPGMKYRHYAPRGRLVLFSERAVANGKVEAKFDELVRGFAGIGAGAQDKGKGKVDDKDNPRLNVGIISCHWPPFAGLSLSPSPAASLPSVLAESIYAPITSSATYTASMSPQTLANGQCQCESSSETQAQAEVEVQVQVTLYNVHIGPDIKDLAHSLFGVLRLFDDLDCTFIFAETVRRGGAAKRSSSSSDDAVVDADANINGNVNPAANINGTVDPAANVSLSLNANADTGMNNNNNNDKNHLQHPPPQQAPHLTESTTRDIEDAVIDRIEKAAAERVE